MAGPELNTRPVLYFFCNLQEEKMSIRLRRSLSFSFFAAFCICMLSCNRGKTETPQQMPPEHTKIVQEYKSRVESSKKTVVAKVNDANITLFDLFKEMNVITPEFVKSGHGNDPDLKEKVKKEALDRLIYRELAVQDAVRQGLKVQPGDVQQEIAKLKTSLKTEDAYRQQLGQMAVSEDELKAQIERGILVSMITEKEIFGKVSIDPELVKKTYEKEKKSYKGPKGQMTFEEARPAIERKLMTPLVQKREEEWINGLKKASKIEIMPEQPSWGIAATPFGTKAEK